MKKISAAVVLVLLLNINASAFQKKTARQNTKQKEAAKQKQPAKQQESTKAPTAVDERLQSMLWVQTSLEYRAACAQAYAGAARALDAGLVKPRHTAATEQVDKPCRFKPPAIILDVDETVLNNSPMQARLVANGTSFNREQWNEWCLDSSAKLIEGVGPFIQYARSRGVAVFFVTNRSSELDAATARNLTNELGYNVTPDMVMCKEERPEWTSNKSSRRAVVAHTHRVVLLIGDQFGDFVQIEEGTPEERVEAGKNYMNQLGRSWILIPNPNYGDWEQALYKYDFSLDRNEIKHQKNAALRPWKK